MAGSLSYRSGGWLRRIMRITRGEVPRPTLLPGITPVALYQDAAWNSSREDAEAFYVGTSMIAVAGQRGYMQLEPQGDRDLILWSVWANAAVTINIGGSALVSGASSMAVFWRDDQAIEQTSSSLPRFCRADQGTVADPDVGGTDLLPQDPRFPHPFGYASPAFLPPLLVPAGSRATVSHPTANQAFVVQILGQTRVRQ